MSKITYTYLRDICDVNQGLQISIDKRFKEPKENRYFYITVQFLKDSYLEKYYIENPTKSTICEEDDILVVRTGNTGQIITGIKGCFHNNFFKVNFDKNKLNSKYLYYCLTTKEKQYEMAKRAGITTIPDLNHFMFLDMQIPLQSKENQDSIVNILDSLNSKIELNNKINKELEAMAKTLYDYWFVQFDFPDVNGKPYKSSGGKMVYNQELKREIPDGWGVENIFKLMDVQYGFPFDTSKFTDDISKKPIVRIRDILQNTISTYSSQEIDNKFMLYKNDLLIGMDGNFHINFWNETGAYLNQRCVRIRTKEDSQISNFQVYFEITPYIKAREKNVSRTTVGHLSDKDLKSLFLLVPNQTLNQKSIFDSMLNKLVTNKVQNQELAKLRDWLLPMLMNGQVSVKDA